MPKKTSKSDQPLHIVPKHWVLDGQKRVMVVDPADIDRRWKPDTPPSRRMVQNLIVLSAQAHKTLVPVRDGEADDDERCEVSNAALEPPAAFLLEMLVPMSITGDFLANLTEIYQTRWIPTYGVRRAKWLWRRQCIGLVVRHWFDVGVTAVERVRKAIISWG